MKFIKIHIQIIAIISLLANSGSLWGMDVSPFPPSLMEAIQQKDVEAVKFYLQEGQDPLRRYTSMPGKYITPLSVALVGKNDAIINAMLGKIDTQQLAKTDFVQLLDNDQFDILRAIAKKGVRQNQLELAFLEYLSTIGREDIGRASVKIIQKSFDPQVANLAKELGLNIFELGKKIDPKASASVKAYFVPLVENYKKFAALAFAASDPDSFLSKPPIDVTAQTLATAVLQRPLKSQERELLGFMFSARAKRRSGEKLIKAELEAWQQGAEAFADLSQKKPIAAPTTATATAAAAAATPSPPATTGTLSSAVSYLTNLWKG